MTEDETREFKRALDELWELSAKAERARLLAGILKVINEAMLAILAVVVFLSWWHS